MTDRELLELAAKAAGVQLASAPHDHVYCGVLTTSWDKERNTPYWSPLTDDGDALRLAVKLRIKFGYDDNLPPELGLPQSGAYAIFGHRWVAETGPDENAATRRAIVRAAAEIGRTMP